MSKSGKKSENRKVAKDDRNLKNQVLSSEKKDFVFGYHSSKEVIQQGRAMKVFLQEDAKGKRVNEIKECAKIAGVSVKWVPKSKLSNLTNNAVHQGIAVLASPYRYLTLSKLISQTKREEPFFLILDSLEDPHNLGSILRTADATGVDGVILPKHNAVGITPTVVKTSTGAVEHVPVVRVSNLVQTVALLKQEGFWIFGTDMEGLDYRKWQIKGKLALIIGNEGRGIRSLLKKEVDEMLAIPMNGHVQSLNAGVAAGILMYEVYRERNLFQDI
ncbi:MAG: 23S rRNA (guanosine(2251)-2'-O)-methyltransferase RlmB [Lactobacillales bacterium]|jgi:23S rRNA (guanosine2251-2'-O)-methyltransferase|nr:23S rRNA (guanosine(2251)-2'-O)-methyltransferase RlmB [Lactobacillales bacterium]